MKRGLKVVPVKRFQRSYEVKETSPMKRGLKVVVRLWVMFPSKVKETSPMKRGLKGRQLRSSASNSPS